MSKKKVIVNYTNRDFDSIKQDLREHARRYFPDTYRDFSENSFGSYITDTVSYVGDMLSFYLDYQVNESFLETAIEYDNVRKLAKNAGYKFHGRPAAFGIASFYVMIPSNTSGQGPRTDLLPVLKQGSEFRTSGGTTFVLTEDVDFSNPNLEIVAARVGNTGNTTEYAIRAHGQVKSTVLYRTQLAVGDFQKLLRLRIGPSSISEIKSVIDSEGNVYYEVENLAQDVVYVDTTNPTARQDGVRQIMKPKIVPRRFVMEQDDYGTYIQFGYGSEETISSTDIADPTQIALKMSGKPYETDSAFDPSRLLDTNTLGVAPSNTTLTILYYRNSSDTVNVSAGSLNTSAVVSMEFPRASSNTSPTLQTLVRQSLEVSNENPIIGNTSVPSSEELRHRSYAAKFSQMRSVTRHDYEASIYMMPPKYGSIKRASVYNDPSSTNRRLSIYVVSEDGSGNLVTTNSTIKENIKVWLNKNKMLNDNIDIYDAHILNIGFDYEIVVDPTMDKIDVLNRVQNRLISEMSQKMYIGEPFYITNVFNIINKVDGVIDTTKVVPIAKLGSGYSPLSIPIEEMKSHDGTYLKVPKNCIIEIKNFNSDIRGSAV
jgi:hypothetical protein